MKLLNISSWSYPYGYVVVQHSGCKRRKQRKHKVNVKTKILTVFLLLTITVLISTTFYSVPFIPQVEATESTFYSGIGDGDIYCGTGSWNTTHDYADGTARPSETVLGVRSYYSATSTYYDSRGFLPFDTSGIPDTATITSAILNVSVSALSQHVGTRNIALVQTTQASTSTLVNADYNQCGTIDNPIEGAPRIVITSTGWAQFTLNATGRSWINKTGWTKLGIRAASLSCDDVAPTDGVQETSLSIESVESANDPQLIIVWSGADTNIVFETGMETGVLKPPWDRTEGEGTMQVSQTHVRSGSYSLYMYQKAPPKSEKERRSHMKEFGSSLQMNEGYFSWWIYYDSQFAEDNPDWGPVLGGWQLWWGPTATGPTYMWWNGGRFGIERTNKKFKFSYGWGKMGGVPDFDADAKATGHNWYLNYYSTDYIGQWIHLQVYFKLGQASDGIVRAWFNNVLVAEKTGITTDPRGYSSWTNNPVDGGGCTWRGECENDGFPNLTVELYQGTNSYENWLWVDDVVASITKVSESYYVGYQSPEFESWEDGFESGDFSAWNSTDYANGGVAPSITSTYKNVGVYSANFTTDGSANSYSRAMYLVQNITEIYQRSYVRFEDLPDTNHTRIAVMRLATTGGTYISAVSVYKLEANYYWAIHITGDPDLPSTNYTLKTINADTWYCLEFYFNATANGNATLWVDNQLTCEATGDYSSLGLISRVYPYIYVVGAQSSPKTVYHDNFRVDDTRIGSGTPEIFQTSIFFSTEGEQSPLSGVKINGTETDASGYYEWTNLTYNTIYTFVVEKPTGYYPLWVLNVEGSFYWNGTYYILSHNVTEQYEGYLEIYFSSQANEPYINATDTKLTSASLTDYLLDFTAYNGSGTSTTDIYTSGNGNATYVYNSQSWSYDGGTDIVQVVASHSSSVSVQVSWGFMGTYTLENQNAEYENGGAVPYLTSSDGTITALSSTTLQSTFTVQHASGTSQTDIYTLGWPVKTMTGQSSYYYDRANNKITVYALHSSPEEIIILWGSADATPPAVLVPFLDFIWAGDYLGFIQAVYIRAFQSADLFWGILIFLFMVPLYIRTRSLLLMSILWILLGSLFLIAMPIVSGLALLLLSLGLAGMFFRLFMKTRT